MDRRKSGSLGWFLQRLSALYLVFGLAVHFLAIHFLVERPITFEKVQARLFSPAWIFFDWTLLVVAVFHGLNGVWGVVLDWRLTPLQRRLSGWLIVAGGVVMVVWGLMALVPFYSAATGDTTVLLFRP